LPLANESNFSRFLRTLFQQDLVVYSKPPFVESTSQASAELATEYPAQHLHGQEEIGS